MLTSTQKIFFPLKKQYTLIRQKLSSSGIRFHLNEDEIDQYCYLYENVHQMNDYLMEVIRKSLCIMRNEFKVPKFLSQMEKNIKIVSESRQNSKLYLFSTYEFYKFCEYIHQAIYHIMKYEHNSSLLLISFIARTIFPLFFEIEKLLDKYKKLFRKKSKKYRIKNKKSNLIRQKLLFDLNFKTLINDEFDLSRLRCTSFTIDTLICFASNLSAPYFLLDYDSIQSLEEKYKSIKRYFSKKFIKLLILNGELAKLVCKARQEFSDYLIMNHNSLFRLLHYKYLVVPELDYLNEIYGVLGKESLNIRL